MSKLIIRAEILSAIKKIQSSNALTNEFFQQIINDLKKITDLDCAADVLIKEFIKFEDEQSTLIIKFLLTELLEKDFILEKFKKILSDVNLKDEIKLQCINYLKEIDDDLKYDDIVKYVDNPDALIDFDTENLLAEAVYNPAVKVDFCDFLASLSDEDARLLLQSLADEYSGDKLANILSPILFSTGDLLTLKIVINLLGETKSAIAYISLEKFLKNSGDDELIALVKKQLKVLKLAGIKNENIDEYYKSVNANSEIMECLVSFPDGHFNLAVITSRKYKNNLIKTFLTVVNPKYGILDCFGLSDVTKYEYKRIIEKFTWDSNRINIPSELVKTIFERAEEKNYEYGIKIPYEYICWNILLNDVPEIENYERYLSLNLEKTEVNSKKMDKFFESSLLDNWFIDEFENDAFSELVESVNDELNKKNEKIIEYTENLINQYIHKIYDEDEIKHFNNKLLLSSYLAQKINKPKTSAMFYSLISEKDFRDVFLTEIIKKSIYEYYLRKKEQFENLSDTKNIFMKNNRQELSLNDKAKIFFMIKEIEDKWAKNV